MLATEWIEIWGDMGRYGEIWRDMERYGEIGARHRMDRGRAAGQVAAGGHQPAHRDGRGLLHLSAARCRILPLRSAPRRPTPYPHGTLSPSPSESSTPIPTPAPHPPPPPFTQSHASGGFKVIIKQFLYSVLPKVRVRRAPCTASQCRVDPSRLQSLALGQGPAIH